MFNATTRSLRESRNRGDFKWNKRAKVNDLGYPSVVDPLFNGCDGGRILRQLSFSFKGTEPWK
jgi:hypothetical protein